MATSYEVQLRDEGRWTISSVYKNQESAMDAADTLTKTARAEAVRVVMDNGRSEPDVIFEQFLQRKDDPNTISPIDAAPVCRDESDFYATETRLTVGRLLRRKLNEIMHTPLEVIFDNTMLKQLTRIDEIYDRGVQRVASIQARTAQCDYQERVEFLYKAVQNITEASRNYDQTYPLAKEEPFIAILKEKGKPNPESLDRHILYALATELKQQGEWKDKLALLLDHLESEHQALALPYLDGAIAEVCDNVEALKSLLGPQQDPLTAVQAVAEIATGRWEPGRWASAAMVRLAKALQTVDMPYTKGVMLERVTAFINRTGRLGKAKVTDAAALTLLSSALRRDLGFEGGAPMALAVTNRAMSALSRSGEDLLPEECIRQVQTLMPNKLARLGYLFDIMDSDYGRKHLDVVCEAATDILGEALKQPPLAPVEKLSDEEWLSGVHDRLKARLERTIAPQEVKDDLNRMLDMAIVAKPRREKLKDAVAELNKPEEREEPAEAEAEEEPKKPKTFQPQKNEKGYLVYPAGTFLFKQGDDGDNAYFLHSGRIEIFMETDDAQTRIATVGRGDVVGEMALIHDVPRMASARALEDTEVSALSHKALHNRLQKLQDYDPVLRRLIDIFVQRLRDWPTRTR